MFLEKENTNKFSKLKKMTIFDALQIVVSAILNLTEKSIPS